MYVNGDIIMKYRNISGFEYEISYKVGKLCTVIFIETGSVRRNINYDNAKAGKVKDLFQPMVAGIGYMGNATYLPKERILWKNMLHRLKGHESYTDCSVCDRWLCLENFVEDIRSMELYEEWLNGDYDLDKDSKYQDNTVYSKQFCVFIKREDHRKHPKRVAEYTPTYQATHDDGTIVTFRNQRRFAGEYGLCYKNLNRAIKKGGRVKGWKVIELTDTD